MWHSMATAPKGGGAERVDDPAYVEPPEILLLSEGGKMAVGHWDWYYAEGGSGCIDGLAWYTEAGLFSQNHGAPIGWTELPPADPLLIPRPGQDEMATKPKLFIWCCPTYGCAGMHDPAYEGSLLYVVAENVEDARREAMRPTLREYDHGAASGEYPLREIAREPDIVRDLPCAELVEWKGEEQISTERRAVVARLRYEELCDYDNLSAYGEGVADAIDFVLDGARAEEHLRSMLSHYGDFAEEEQENTDDITKAREASEAGS